MSAPLPYTLWDFQDKAKKAIFDYFYTGRRGNPLVVAPTGSGKSVIIADTCRHITETWGDQKVLVISDTQDILLQNYKALQRQNPGKKIGLYSAGLKCRTIEDITIAGIQSIYDKPDLFEEFDLIIVDEAHSISLDSVSRYRKLFSVLRRPVVGFTATPYRLGTGYLHLGKDAFFDDIVYTIRIKTLQEHNPPILCKITCKDADEKMDASKVKKQAGDFIISELSLAFDRRAITERIVEELTQYKHTRKKWLAYAIDIDHCDHICEIMNEYGISAKVVHSRMIEDRRKVIQDFKDGKFQCLISVAMLTKGFDVPDVDLIALMRPTASPNLHVQIIGRGLRVAKGKTDCLIKDFAGNLLRNGPIDAPIIKIKGNGKGEAVMKVCQNCDEIVPIATKVCPMCLNPFQFKHNLTIHSADAEAMSKVIWHDVKRVEYAVYPGGKNYLPILWVKYYVGLSEHFKEPVCVEHSGYTRHRAEWWWKRRSCGEALPETAQEALQESECLATPKRILVDESGKYPKIKDQDFGGEI